MARRNLLWDILRLPSSRRAALGLHVILTLWIGRGMTQPPYALLNIGTRCATHCATGDNIFSSELIVLGVRLTKYQQIHSDIPPAAQQIFTFLFTY